MPRQVPAHLLGAGERGILAGQAAPAQPHLGARQPNSQRFCCNKLSSRGRRTFKWLIIYWTGE